MKIWALIVCCAVTSLSEQNVDSPIDQFASDFGVESSAPSNTITWPNTRIQENPVYFHCEWDENVFCAVFIARCTLVQSAILRSHVVCPCLSVCLSVCDVGGLHIGWNSSEIISPLVSLGCSLSADPNIRGLLQGEHRKFWPKVTHPCWFKRRKTFDRKLRPNGYR